jgi:D-alanyl-D-alanine carboxypeptidase
MSLPAAPPDYASYMAPHEEARDLCPAGLDVFGREVSLVSDALEAWRAMQVAAKEEGVQLLLLSGFRSVARQTEILSRKLESGEEFADILRVNAYPGFSEHHTGRAVDIGSSSCAHFEEAFECTPEYAWLDEHAAEFGFFLSYPRENKCRIAFEPWHWCFAPGGGGLAR